MSKKDKFIEKANDVHNNKYDYSAVNYLTVDDKVDIICKTHGTFTQTPYHHINRKQGCPQCGRANAGLSKTSNTDEFIKKAKSIHGDKYCYDKTVYTSAKNKLTITCQIHGDFEQLASGHLSGYGCKQCTSYGKGRVSSHNPCKLYYLYLPDFGYYKIGITSQDITHRYRTKFDLDQFQVIFIKEYSSGDEAYCVEQDLLQKYHHLKYAGNDKILKSGNTEIFIEDIFKGNYNDFHIQ